jgi:hypothetical protein
MTESASAIERARKIMHITLMYGSQCKLFLCPKKLGIESSVGTGVRGTKQGGNFYR